MKRPTPAVIREILEALETGDMSVAGFLEFEPAREMLQGAVWYLEEAERGRKDPELEIPVAASGFLRDLERFKEVLGGR